MKCFLSVLLLSLASIAAPAADWSHWRGPEQNGVSRDRDLPDKWSPNPDKPENLVWTAPYGGRSTPIVQGGRVYLINKCGEGLSEQERVMCFDEKDGKMLWERKFNVFHTDIVSVRLGWTTMCGDPETGNVYAHGTQGLLFCFDKDGNIVWKHSLTEEFGRISGYGGRVTSPIVDGDLVILSMLNASWGYQGMGRTRLVAFGKRTGRVVWWTSTGLQPKDTYYSTPVVAVIGGQRLVVTGGGDGGVHAFKVGTGEKVWSYVFGTAAVNCSPVVQGDRVYIGHGEENDDTNQQGRVICVDGAKVENGKPKLIWKVDGIKAKFASPIIHEGKLYICDEVGKLFCLDANTGKKLWMFHYGKNTKGSPVLADGKIYIAEVNSKFHILKPKEKGCEVLDTQFFRKTASGNDVEINGSPAVVNGRVYFMTSDNLYCIGKKGEPKSGPIPEPVKEGPAGNQPAVLQVYPADIAVHPGESVALIVWAYDDHGRLIGRVAADSWELAGMRPPEGLPPPAPPAKGAPPPKPPPALRAKLSEKAGKETAVTADKTPLNQFGRVVAKLGNLTGECRVRVAARVPFTADFSKVPEGRTPGGWVNCQGKFAVVKLKDGKQVLKKLAVNASPLVARANAYITLPWETNYTIQADVMGKKVRDDMPDIGVVANRYTLQLAGNTQQLRLISWDALPRVDKTIGFGWKPDVWYCLKLSCDVQGSKAIVRGKVWERGAKEPDWTVEFVDTTPNTEGAAALHGYAAGILAGQVGAEIFYDNVSINPNEKNGK